MVCAINKIDSNITALYIAEEECINQLPTTPVWYGYEPNSYSDMGGEISTVASSTINASRQNRKGTVTDLDASGGFNIDFQQTKLNRLLQGFFFADARQPDSTQRLNGANVPITSVTASSKTYAAAAGLAIFGASQLVLASGFAQATNNGLKTVVSNSASTAVIAETLADESSPPATAKLEHVGFVFASGDVNLAVVGGIPSLTSTDADFTTFNDLFPGAWIYLGDDVLANRFANNAGYARIKSIAAKSLTFDNTTWTPVNETGTAKTIRFYIATSIKNENVPSLIKRRTYSIERQLGLGANDVQAEYLEGSVPNELTLNIPQADKLNVDLTFVACGTSFRTGDVGDLIKAGTRVAVDASNPYNTSSNIVRNKLTVKDGTTSNPSSLFGFATEADITINNNVTPAKAIGKLGAFDVNLGNFEVGGSITAYFTTVAAVKAVRNNADVEFNVIAAMANAGFIFDIPLLGLGGGRLTVEKDAPIMLPLENMAAQNANGYTMLYASFPYLPNLAMPV